MRLAKLNPGDVLYIAQNLRECDKREIFSTRWSESPEDFTADILSFGEFAWVCGLERPIAAIGAAPLRPGCWTMWMFATDEFNKIGISLTKFAKRVIFPALKEAGAHRLETLSIEGHYTAHRWLEYLGAHREAEHKSFGKNRETFYSYSWTR